MRKYFERLERNRYLPSSLTGHGYDGWLTTSLTQLTLILEDQKLLSLVIAAATAAGKALLGKIINTVSGLGEVLTRDLNNDSETRDQDAGPYQVPLAVDVPEYKRTGPREFILDTANAVNSDGSRKYHLDVQLQTLVVTSQGQPALTSRRERVCTGQTHDPEMQLQSPLEAPMLPVKLFLLLVPSILPSC